MYIQRQRKNLKPCLAFQRHDSKILKSSLRKLRLSKRIHVLYKLLSSVLPISCEMSSIQDCIVQAALATSPRVTNSSNPYDLHLDLFPGHIYPQLRSLKQAIAKANRFKQMEPVHWQSGIRPNRPFESPKNNFSFSPPRPPPPPQQGPRQRQIPTQYYLEQAPFYAENFGPDPFATAPEVIQPGLLKSFILKFFTIFSKFAVPGWDVIASLVFRLLLLSRFIARLALRFPFKQICNFVANVEWEVLLAMAIANQIVKYLPGMGREVLPDAGDGDGPMYIMFVQGGRVIGTGPVMGESL
jgi:hypothetical protein